MQTTINWAVAPAEFQTITEITDRATRLAAKCGVIYRRDQVLMDLTAAHANACPLRLEELLAADDGNFGHDVFGIRRHLNRETGQLENCFRPRFAR